MHAGLQDDAATSVRSGRVDRRLNRTGCITLEGRQADFNHGGA
jgi:hypothetical protein